MERRALTLLLSSGLAAVLGVASLSAPVPYVALKPGPTFDTLTSFGGVPVIGVTGAETFPTDGQLDLTTVNVDPSLTLAEAVAGWFAGGDAVVPRSSVFPDGQTNEEADAVNAAQMAASQSASTAAALGYLGYEGRVAVGEVVPGRPADGQLLVGDVITAVDGEPVTGSDEVVDRVSSRSPGEQVRFGVDRDGTAFDVVVTTAAADDGRAVVGVSLQLDYDVDVAISLEDVGGPSAGLMFALGIVDKLGPDSLTGGRFIAGTGEIVPDGSVGPIGGITQKLRGARGKGAEVFLVPGGNCPEALGDVPDGLQLVRVDTLSGAVDALTSLAAGGTAPGC